MAAGMLLAALNACASADQRAVPVQPAVQAAAVEAPAQRLRPGRFAATSPRPQEAASPSKALKPRKAPKPVPQQAALPPTVAPAQILGLDKPTVERLLGGPTLVRREPPAEVWQYRTGQCVLDLFLYEESKGYRVRYLEARTVRAETTPTEPCIGSLVAARRGAKTG